MAAISSASRHAASSACSSPCMARRSDSSCSAISSARRSGASRACSTPGSLPISTFALLIFCGRLGSAASGPTPRRVRRARIAASGPPSRSMSATASPTVRLLPPKRFTTGSTWRAARIASSPVSTVRPRSCSSRSASGASSSVRMRLDMRAWRRCTTSVRPSASRTRATTLPPRPWMSASNIPALPKKPANEPMLIPAHAPPTITAPAAPTAIPLKASCRRRRRPNWSP